MLTVPIMAKKASKAYISQGLFELELFVGAGFFSGLVGSGILLEPLRAIREMVKDSIPEQLYALLCTDRKGWAGFEVEVFFGWS